MRRLPPDLVDLLFPVKRFGVGRGTGGQEVQHVYQILQTSAVAVAPTAIPAYRGFVKVVLSV